MSQQQGGIAVATVESWQQWEGRVVGGRFPLGTYVGGGDGSAVYRTDLGGVNAAIKLVAADRGDGSTQLARWEQARKLAHPNLIRILETGRWHADEEQDMFFAVMEYADENLAEVLAQRTLTADEVRDTLPPILAALDYLHGQNLAQGELRPVNVMAVGNDLKLSTDGVCRMNGRSQALLRPDRYAAPEVAAGTVLPQSDIWSLGFMLVEALTGESPAWNSAKQDEPSLAQNMPQPYAAIAKACLQRDPAKRASTTAIRQMLEGKLSEPIASEVKKPDGAAVTPATSQMPAATPKAAEARTSDASSLSGEESRRIAGTAVPPAKLPPTPVSALPDEGPVATMPRRSLVPAAIAIVLGIAAVIGIFRLLNRNPQPTPVSTTQTSAAPVAAEPQAAPAVVTHRDKTAGAVVHKEMPAVSHPARNSIHGTVRVNVQAAVGASGDVTQASLATRGSSKYFSEQALEAAHKWTFTPPTSDGKSVPSHWLLKFEFTRSGDKATAQMTNSK